MESAELTFVAKLRDEASAQARGLRRTLGSLGDRVSGPTIPVNVNASAATSKLAAVNARLEGLEKVSRSAGRGLLALGRYGMVGLGVLGGVAGAGLAAGLRTAAGMETARISFETMLGSAGKAERFLGDLSAFAAKTPFEFPELQTAASSLISAGVNAKKVIPIMTSLGDVTSGMGTGSEGVQRATVALQQMSAAGRITGEDLNQLRDAGVPVFDLLAAATGKSKKEVAALAQAGKLGGRELAQLMKALETGKGLERFSGLMEKQSASLSGQFSTLKDNANMALAGMVEPMLPLIKSGLGRVSGLIASAGEKVPELVGKVRGLSAVIREFGPLSDNAAKGLGSFLGIDPSKIRTLQGIAKDLADVFRNSLGPAIKDTSSILPAFLAPLGLARAALGFLANHTTTAKVAFTVLATALLVVVPLMKTLSAVSTAAAAAKTAYAVVTGRAATAEQLHTRALIQNRAMQIQGAAATAARTAATVASTGASLVAAGAAKAWAAAQRILNVVLAANPIGLIITAIALLGAAFVTAYKKSETFREIVNGVWRKVQSAAGEAVGFLIDGFRMMLRVWLTVADGIISGAAKALGWIPGLGPKLKRANRAFDNMRTEIDSTMADLANDARGWGDSAASGLASGISANEYKAIAAATSMANKVAVQANAELESRSPSKVFERLGKTIPQGLAEGVKNGAAGATQAIADLVAKTKQLVEDKKLGKAAGDAIVDLLEDRNKKLRAKARDRETTVARLEKARDRLKGLISDRAQLAESTAGAARGFGSITAVGPDSEALESHRSAQRDAASELERLTAEAISLSERRTEALSAEEIDATALAKIDAETAKIDLQLAAAKDTLATASTNLSIVESREAITAENLARKMGERSAQLSAFANNVATLRARGLNEATVQEIIAQGAEAGAASAAALAASTDAQLGQINAVAAEITAQAAALGDATAGAMYDAGIKSAQGMVRGLVDEVEAIDKAARRLARRLVKAIKKELGIKSPSAVMARTFGEVPAGAAEGILGGIPVVDRAAAKLAASAARAATAELGGSMVPTLPSVAVRATSGQTITLRHEIVSPDGSVSELDARTIAAMIATDPRAAKTLEEAVRTATNRREAITIGPSR